jgi:16S rRNA G966 N2-methylase RsmD
MKPLSQFLGKRYAARNLLLNPKFHNTQTSIPKDEVTPEKEPQIRGLLSHYAKQICENPDCILVDSYELDERKRDWKSLEDKGVLEKDEILPIDARSRPGHKILDHHMRHFWDVTNHKGISVKSLFTQENLEKALLANLMMHSTPYPTEIRRMLVAYGSLGNVTKYRTVTSKAIVQYFKAKRVLDPCAGWGGRMLGTLSAAPDTYYCGCEPDPNTCQALLSILEDDAIPTTASDRADIWGEPAEAVLPTLKSFEKFDLVLTSPPYFNLELYTSGSQSVNQWTSWTQWVENWLKPVILGSLACLKETGVSCWSVKNFQSDKKYPLADVTKKIHEDAGWTLVKTVKMTGSGRMGSTKSHSEEETFCFRRC